MIFQRILFPKQFIIKYKIDSYITLIYSITYLLAITITRLHIFTFLYFGKHNRVLSTTNILYIPGFKKIPNSAL